MNKSLFSNNTIVRFISSVFLISISLYCIIQGGLVFLIALSILTFLISYEYISITEKINTLYLKITKSFLNIIIFLLSILSIKLSIFFFIIVLLLNLVQKKTFKTHNIFVLLGPIYLCLPLIFLYNIRMSNSGLDIILWFLLIVWFTDIFSYICGNYIGGKKLLLSLSPNKTWSGFIGGILIATIFSVIYFYINDYKALNGFLYGLILSFFTQIGDLFESWIKRKHFVKDSGKLIPGHGGFLDRIDGLLLSSIVLYTGYIFYGM